MRLRSANGLRILAIVDLILIPVIDVLVRNARG